MDYKQLAARLYRHLEYYRKYMPYCLGMDEEVYAKLQEAKGVDEALALYRNKVEADAPPTATDKREEQSDQPTNGDTDDNI